MSDADVLLHSERLLRLPFVGKSMLRNLTQRVQELRDKAAGHKDPGVTVLIRTRNDGKRLESLFADIGAQDFSGPVQVVVVDTESTDDTLVIARRHKATIVPITQHDFNYAVSLNRGFDVAKHPYVLCLVGHSNLTNKYALKAASYYATQPKFGGAFFFGVPDTSAKAAELLVVGRVMAKHMRQSTYIMAENRPGLLAGNASLINKKVWRELGGYDERYAAGGEDSALGRSMLARGYTIAFDPVLTIYHSHGLTLSGWPRQLREWQRLDRPRPFDEARLKKFRRDLS